MKNKKKLSISSNPIYTAFLEYAFPCAILQSDKRFQNLLYVSFLNLYWNDNSDCKLQLYNFNLFDYLLFDNRLIDKTIISIDSKITKKIKKWLDEGYYIYAFIDETKLKETQLTHFSNTIHESLVYGYDDNFSSFSILNFDQERKFGTININQSEFKKSCLSNINETRFVLLKPSFDMVNVEVKLIEKRIGYYLTEKNIYVGKTRNILPNDYKWGISIYNSLSKYINTNSKLDFRFFKLLEEHKVYLYKVYKYLQPLINDNKLDKDFLDLIEITKKMNFFVLRQRTTEDFGLKNKILILLSELKTREVKLLQSLRMELQEYITQHKEFNIEYLD